MAKGGAARELGERFGYPEELTSVLDRIGEAARRHLGSDTSVVLSPSVSTGDFLWTRETNRVELLSDVDGFVFTAAPTAALAAFSEELRALERVAGPPFSIDLAMNRPDALRRIASTYQMAETREAGFVLSGPDVLDAFPSSFDPRASHQAFLENLWKPICALEKGDAAFARATARVLCDLAILAASEQGACVPGHAARARWFLDSKPAPLGSEALLREAVEMARMARMKPPGDASRLRPMLAPSVLLTCERLGVPFDRGNVQGLVKQLAAWIPPRSFRRCLGELRPLLRRPTGLISDLRWWLSRKEAWAGAAALHLLVFIHEGGSSPPAGVAELLGWYARAKQPAGQGEVFVAHAVTTVRAGHAELYPHPSPATAVA